MILLLHRSVSVSDTLLFFLFLWQRFLQSLTKETNPCTILWPPCLFLLRQQKPGAEMPTNSEQMTKDYDNGNDRNNHEIFEGIFPKFTHTNELDMEVTFKSHERRARSEKDRNLCMYVSD